LYRIDDERKSKNTFANGKRFSKEATTSKAAKKTLYGYTVQRKTEE
jgi:hypothetical protein